MSHRKEFTSETLRRRLAGATGKRYWRTLEELADTEEFQRYVEREFPENATEWNNAHSRRQFLKVMAASLALAGLNGCNSSQETNEQIVPYVRTPEIIVPGKPLFFATAMPFGGVGTGLLVESHMGRPTRVDGNPLHPAIPSALPVGNHSPDSTRRERDAVQFGASHIFAQASILDFYDPDRSQSILHQQEISTWDDFTRGLRQQMDNARAKQGAGLKILTERISSPTIIGLMERLLEQCPQAQWVQYEPVQRDNEYQGAQLAFGQPVNAISRFDRADVILSLDADFLSPGIHPLIDARKFARRRDVVQSNAAQATMNRLYVVEPTMTLTGAMADHRLPLRAHEIDAFARLLARRLGVEVAAPDDSAPDVPAEWLDALVDDLRNYRVSDGGASLVVAGPWQPPHVHALVHAINERLGNFGQTVLFTDPVTARPANETAGLRQLVKDMRAGQVETLLIIDSNPAFTVPVDLDFPEALTHVPYAAHLGAHVDETAVLCQWHVPRAHFLEAWEDVRAFDGTVTLMQPMIRPLYQGRSTTEFLSAVLGEPDREAYDILRDSWRDRYDGDDFERFWRQSLHDGVVRDSRSQTQDLRVRTDFLGQLPNIAAPTSAEIEVVFRPDPTVWDGRFANVGWLQELPKPFTKLTWDNAALVSPAFAARLGMSWRQDEPDAERRSSPMVDLTVRGQTLRIPLWIVPGLPDNSVTVHFGLGRRVTGRVGTGTGFNVYQLRHSEQPWYATGTLKTAGERYPLACTQHHQVMENRHPVRAGTLDELHAAPTEPPFMQPSEAFVTHEHNEPIPTLYPEFPYKGYKWGMAINLNTCIGCNACTIACQAENNIPVVGKEQVQANREMHWIRIDTYYEGEPENPSTYFQPLPCMHCEKAPCELVCPVMATTHSHEGLNEMTYNRCVGTRYCSNNCPYKVRRFNFFEFNDWQTPSLKLLHNPDVTVRSRGVMEKCTYCVQRISQARIESEKEGRRIQDGEVVTACQVACPTAAIIFGDLNDPNSLVAKYRESPLDYGLLEDLGTQPRTTYLASLKNPNPRLKGQEA